MIPREGGKRKKARFKEWGSREGLPLYSRAGGLGVFHQENSHYRFSSEFEGWKIAPMGPWKRGVEKSSYKKRAFFALKGIAEKQQLRKGVSGRARQE